MATHNDPRLLWVRYSPQTMLLDTATMSLPAEVAHRRLSDFALRSKPWLAPDSDAFLSVTRLTKENLSGVIVELKSAGWRSYDHAGKTITQLDLEVKELLAKAEQADSTPLEAGLRLPKEVQRRQERKAKLAAARTEIEARARARAAAEMVVYEAELAERQAQEASGAKLRGSAPQAPSAEPKPTDQYNVTDAESRIMKAGNGPHSAGECRRKNEECRKGRGRRFRSFGGSSGRQSALDQSYNAQAAVEVQSRMIVGPHVSQAPNDKQELVPTVAAIAQPVASVAAGLIDSGFYSAAAVQAVEQTGQGIFSKHVKTPENAYQH